ncbi:hypothetical protein D3C76_1308960 [compost metagenome]
MTGVIVFDIRVASVRQGARNASHGLKLPDRPSRHQPLAGLGKVQHFDTGLLHLDLIIEIDTGQIRTVGNDLVHETTLGVLNPARIDGVDVQQIVSGFLAGGITIAVEQADDQVGVQLVANFFVGQEAFVFADDFNVERVDPIGGGLGDRHRRRGDVVIGLRSATCHKTEGQQQGKNSHV